jgi:hypothetical protein
MQLTSKLSQINFVCGMGEEHAYLFWIYCESQLLGHVGGSVLGASPGRSNICESRCHVSATSE